MPPDWADRLRVNDWPGEVGTLPPDWVERLKAIKGVSTADLLALPPGWLELLRSYQGMPLGTLEMLQGMPPGWAKVIKQVCALAFCGWTLPGPN